jgi:hypothetical protein
LLRFDEEADSSTVELRFAALGVLVLESNPSLKSWTRFRRPRALRLILQMAARRVLVARVPALCAV